MLLLLLFAFIGGIVTILSPCILPILPVVLSGSVGGGHRRPVGIVTGFIASFTFFTLSLSAIVRVLGVPADALRSLSVIVILFFGLSLLVPQTQILFEKMFSRLSSKLPVATGQPSNGFWGGVVVGLSLGLIWTPCVGPILASVITLAITSQVSAAAFFITLAYALGTGLPMLAITYGGRELLNRTPWLLSNTAKIQKGFGVLMILTAIAIQFQLDRQFQVLVLDAFPNYSERLTGFERNQQVMEALEEL